MKLKIKLIHLEALIVYLVYTLGTKYILLISLTWGEAFKFYLPGPFVSAIFGILFLYVFSHEDFFRFAKVVEKREQKAEKKWVHKLIHTGKVVAVFLVATLSGPLLAALTARFLLRYSKLKYLIVFLCCFLGSLLFISVIKGGAIMVGIGPLRFPLGPW